MTTTKTETFLSALLKGSVLAWMYPLVTEYRTITFCLNSPNSNHSEGGEPLYGHREHELNMA